MTERRGDQGFAVVTQSVTGARRPGRGPHRPRSLGVVIVAVAAIALVGIGFFGPRLNGAPNFDVSYFATPTPSETATPTPTPTRPNQTPLVTPLPVISAGDDVALNGSLAITGDAFRYVDLATGTTRRIHDVMLWRDAVFATGDSAYVCICFVDDYDANGPSRTIDLVRITGDDVATTTLDRLRASPDSVADQPDPLLDAAVDHDHQRGVIALAQRTKTSWEIGVRPLDVRGASLGREKVVGRIALPPFPGGAGATPMPSDQPVQENLYLDGPHVRMSPDGRTAFVWALAQRYVENADPTVTHGGWRVRLAADGSIEDVAEAPDIAAWPQYCNGLSFAGEDRLVALCADPGISNPSGQPTWIVRTFDGDGRVVSEIRLPEAAEYGYAEPLVDQANGRVYLWDAIALRIVRIDLDDGAMASATFDPAASSAAGVTSGAAALPPEWHDGDSAVQQILYESLAGSPDGRHLYGIGMHPRQVSDTWSVAALGVYVIDPATLALDARWAPAASDVWVATLPDGRIVTGSQPGMNVDGDAVPWEGSLTLRDAADGRILARYGRVSTDQAPVLVRP